MLPSSKISLFIALSRLGGGFLSHLILVWEIGQIWEIRPIWEIGRRKKKNCTNLTMEAALPVLLSFLACLAILVAKARFIYRSLSEKYFFTVSLTVTANWLKAFVKILWFIYTGCWKLTQTSVSSIIASHSASQLQVPFLHSDKLRK